MKLLAFLNRHKTKLTGFALVIAGSLQANTTVLQSAMSPAQFAWFTVIVGCIVAGLGFINGNKPQS